MDIKELILILIFCSVNGSCQGNIPDKVSCKDEKGLNVDWFYIYKLPKHYKSNALEDDDLSGLRYIYITSRHHDHWILSKRFISSGDSMPALTLEPLLDNANVLLVGYNDEYPNGTYFLTDGHAKGIVATDGNVSALWLIHSVPKFPTIPGYNYPNSAIRYGQSFLCLTLTSQELQKVGEQMVYNEPNIYYSRIPYRLKGKYDNLEKALKKQWRTTPPYNNVLDLKTLDGQEFRSFAKSSRYGRDLYEDWLAPELGGNLLVEAWRNGPGNMASNCSASMKVFNIASVQESKMKLAFKTTDDHSKWAVTQANGFKLWRWRFGGADDWICVGDINRQAHQLERGGGTVCQKNLKVTKLYRNLVKNYEPCG